MSDDRPRKSWRDIDKMRDKSRHRDDRDGPVGLGPRGQRSQKSYRAALDRLFESGRIGELVDQKSPGSEKPSRENRIKLMRQVRDAVGRDEVTRAVDRLVDAFGLPDDWDVLVRVLEHREAPRQLQAMERMDALLEQDARPRRTGALLGQLKMIRDFSGDPDLEDLATRLIDRI